MDNTIYFH